MRKQVLTFVAIAFTLVTFAQKDEVKAATKALKKADYTTAKTMIDKADAMNTADAKMKALVAFTKGKIYLTLANEAPKLDPNALSVAAGAFAAVKDNGKYKTESLKSLGTIVAALNNKALAYYNAKDYAKASDAFLKIYQLGDSKDHAILFNAATTAALGEKDNALDLFLKLKETGYTGEGEEYIAKDKTTGKEVGFASKKAMDLQMKTGQFVSPEVRKTPSKLPIIVQQIGYLYMAKGESKKAIAAFDDALKLDPKNVNLLLNKIDLYNKLGDKVKAKEFTEKALELDPTNHILYYNLGVTASKEGNVVDAEKYFKKVLEIKPNYINAYFGLQQIYIDRGNALNEKMNALGTSAADNRKYDTYKAEKLAHYGDAVKVLEKARTFDSEDKDIIRSLKNLYGTLGESEKFMEMKKLLGE
jgi:tetratricopeptide (TPR) repeat protein